MRLCPGDNMGQRAWLGSILIRVSPVADALHFSQCWLSKDWDAFKSPTRNLINAKHEKSLSEYGSGAMLYTASLASFKLYGEIVNNHNNILRWQQRPIQMFF